VNHGIMGFYRITLLILAACFADGKAKAGIPLSSLPSLKPIPPSERIAIEDMTCSFFKQPLNHFDLPRGKSGYYQQRFCSYSGYVPPEDSSSQTTAPPPVLLYTGNESPVTEYINHTGLMFEIAQAIGAHVYFVELRYEGASLPRLNSTQGCLAYSSSIQAIADYANFIQQHIFQQPWSSPNKAGSNFPAVIVFGGSYGGMLSSWLRQLYPSVVAGAVAASAPIWGFPLTTLADTSATTAESPSYLYNGIDSAWRVISRGLRQPYPPTAIGVGSAFVPKPVGDMIDDSAKPNDESQIENHCADNLLAAWPLIRILGQTPEGRKVLTRQFRLCDPLEHKQDNGNSTSAADLLLDWAQPVWFDLAESSYPYPSNYIIYSLTKDTDVTLPAWPIQHACRVASALAQDWNISISGNRTDVRYNITYGTVVPSASQLERSSEVERSHSLTLAVDWDRVTVASAPPGWVPETLRDQYDIASGERRDSSLIATAQSTVLGLLASVRNAISIWYNATGDVQCYNLTAAPTFRTRTAGSVSQSYVMSRSKPRTLRRRNAALLKNAVHLVRQRRTDDAISDAAVRSITAEVNDLDTCNERIDRDGSWPSLCCNEEMNLVTTWASGLGHDVLWPPSVAERGVRTYSDFLQYENKRNLTMSDEYCNDPDGSFGFPQDYPDPWSTWFDTYYGGRRLESYSNIIFSNGLLDPWSSAGVYSSDSICDSMPDTFREHPYSLDERMLPFVHRHEVDGLCIQSVAGNADLVAVIMEYGGHHTDLMYGEPDFDPPSITVARQVELWYIQRWVQKWNEQKAFVV
jgi:pimeloyl-ACP methyl ester carboxylesterase